MLDTVVISGEDVCCSVVFGRHNTTKAQATHTTATKTQTHIPLSPCSSSIGKAQTQSRHPNTPHPMDPYMSGTRVSGGLASAGDVLEMSVVRGVGGVCDMCMCLARGWGDGIGFGLYLC